MPINFGGHQRKDSQPLSQGASQPIDSKRPSNEETLIKKIGEGINKPDYFYSDRARKMAIADLKNSKYGEHFKDLKASQPESQSVDKTAA